MNKVESLNLMVMLIVWFWHFPDTKHYPNIPKTQAPALHKGGTRMAAKAARHSAVVGEQPKAHLRTAVTAPVAGEQPEGAL